MITLISASVLERTRYQLHRDLIRTYQKDVNEVRAICEETGNGHVQLFAKIENQQGIDNLDEIIEGC